MVVREELGGEKNDCSTLCKCVCQAGSESGADVWSGITIAHDDTCAIWK